MMPSSHIKAITYGAYALLGALPSGHPHAAVRCGDVGLAHSRGWLDVAVRPEHVLRVPLRLDLGEPLEA